MNNSRRHILIIPAWMPSAEDPAAGSFILEQAIMLKDESQFQVGLIFQGPAPVPVYTHEQLHLYGIQHVIRQAARIPKVTSLLIRLWCSRYLQVYRAYEKQFGKPDLIHAHSYIAGIAAEYISAQAKIPFVLTEHSTNFLAHTIKRYHTSSLKLALTNAAGIVAVGYALKKAIQEWTDKPILQIPNPVNQSIFSYDPEAGKNSSFTMITVGSLIARKRAELVIRALSHCSDVSLVIIGKGPEEQSLKALAKELGVETAVQWVPYLPSHDVAIQLQKAHVFVSTSKYETFGIAAAEALMCGCPVICTASGGPEEFISEKTGIVLPGNATDNDLAKVIEQIRRDSGIFDPKTIASEAKAQFSGSIVIRNLRQFYNEILEGKQ